MSGSREYLAPNLARNSPSPRVSREFSVEINEDLDTVFRHAANPAFQN